MRKIFALLLAALLCLALPVSALAFAGGTGTAGDPFIITTPAHLDAVRNHSHVNFRLGNDIDLTAYLAPGGAGFAQWGTAGWQPIGSVAAPFTDNFDGNGHVITGLWIDRGTEDFVGLFGIASRRTISNLRVEIAAAGVRGRDSVGGLVGILRCGPSVSGHIINSYVTGTGNVTGRNDVGGLVGRASGIEASAVITNSHATVNVSGLNQVGGLVGTMWWGAIISNSYATGDVNGTHNNVGGLVGHQHDGDNRSIIANSYATGNVSGNNNVGGLVGTMLGKARIRNSYASGNVIGNDTAGGLVGHSQAGRITTSYATGNVIGNLHVGGLVGVMTSEFCSIAYSFAAGNVNNTAPAGAGGGTGGLVGHLSGSISNSYAMGNVSTSSGTPGGLVGSWGGSHSITNSFRYRFATATRWWDGEMNLENDPQSTPSGRHGGLLAANLVPVNPHPLMSQATYMNNGWQFASHVHPYAWLWDSRGFPRLRDDNTESFPFPPMITNPPQNQTLNAGAAATFSVTATTVGFAPLTFQWQRLSGTWNNIFGATSATLSLGSAQLFDNGAQFRVIVSDSRGRSATSNIVTLTVTGGGPTDHIVMFNTQGGSPVPPNQSVPGGALVSVPMSPSRDGFEFAGWYREAAGGIRWHFPTDTVTGNMTLFARWTEISPAIVTGPGLPGGVVGTAYSHTLNATGTPSITWTVETGNQLPPGLNLSTAGVISGTPTTAGIFSFTIRAANNAGFNTRTFNMAVTHTHVLPAIVTNNPLPEGTVGMSYLLPLEASGTSPTWSIQSGSLPTGLNMNAAGLISGTPTAPGTFNFTVSATNLAGTASRSLTIVVNPASVAPEIGTTTLPSGVVGAHYSQTLHVTGTAPITWSIEAGSLPPGLNLSAGGVISGTPTSTGTFSFTVRAENVAGFFSIVLSIDIVSTAVAPVINVVTLPASVAGTPYSFLLNTTAGTAPITWAIISGSLPSGLSLSTAGVISGTATVAGTFNFTVQASNPAGNDAAVFSITVHPAPGGGGGTPPGGGGGGDHRPPVGGGGGGSGCNVGFAGLMLLLTLPVVLLRKKKR